MSDFLTQAPVIGRFAPSPTGPLHLGSLVAAVGSYLFARSGGGKWLLRIEDLDVPRVIPGVADDMLRTLESLALEWDGEIVYQSRRLDAYQAALDWLMDHGYAYPCGCSRADIAMIASAPHDTDGTLVYPGTCRSGLPAGKTQRAVRVKVNDEVLAFQDGLMGRYSQRLSTACGDFVVQRADGPFAYHLAVVVDDAYSGINQVVRGSDLLSSTPRQIYLQKLLGYPAPHYFHLPLVIGPDEGKLSKRDNAVSLEARGNRAASGGGLLLAALRFLGQSPPKALHNASCREILAWAVGNFYPSLIPRRPGPLAFPPG